MAEIDWTNPDFKVSEHFVVHEACYLPSWGKLHNPTPAEQAELIATFALMDEIRDLFQRPVRVHCAIRPEAYNAAIGGAPNSAHITGKACDFDVAGLLCDDVRNALEPLLDHWNFRMERRPGSNWVHIDRAEPRPNRYFIP